MNNAQLIASAPLLIIAATAVTVMLAIAVKRHFAVAGSIAAGGIIAALLVLSAARQPVLHGAVQLTLLLRIDAVAVFATGLLLLGGLAVMGFCFAYFKHRGGENEELILLLLTALLGGMVLVCSSHFASFFIGLETLSVSLFALIGYVIKRSHPLEAAIKYLLLSGVSSAFIVLGMALIYAYCGDLYFPAIDRCLAAAPKSNAMILSGMVFLIAGLGFKLSLIPFHMWTPDVYEGAPAPVTAFIATVSKGAVFILLLRYFLGAGGYAHAPLTVLLSIIAALSIIGGNLLALLQDNVKRLLAYSSISHMGYLLATFVAGRTIAPALLVESLGFYLTAYFITTIGAFGVVSVLSTPLREADDPALYHGLFWRRPWLAGVFTLMLLSLAGIPLTIGFIGKFYIFVAAAEARLWGLLLAVIVGSGLGLYYYLRIIALMSMTGSGLSNDSGEPAPEWISSATLALLTLLLLWLGIYPGQLIDFLQALAAAPG